MNFNIKPKKVTGDWKAPNKIKGDKEDERLMGKGAYEAMLEQTRKKKKIKTTVGTY
jgi:hypothetical protein